MRSKAGKKGSQVVEASSLLFGFPFWFSRVWLLNHVGEIRGADRPMIDIFNYSPVRFNGTKSRNLQDSFMVVARLTSRLELLSCQPNKFLLANDVRPKVLLLPTCT